MKTSNKIIIAMSVVFIAIPLVMLATTWFGTLDTRLHTKDVCQKLTDRPIRVVELTGEYQNRISISHPGPETSPSFWSGMWQADIPTQIEVVGDTLKIEMSRKPKYNEIMRIWSVEYIIRNGEVKKLDLYDWQKQAYENFTDENLREIKANFKPLTDKLQHSTYIYD